MLNTFETIIARFTTKNNTEMKKYLTFLFSFLAIALSSCKRDFLSLETNPNVPSVAAPNLLLSGALRQTADIVNGGRTTYYDQYACWIGYISYSTGVSNQ